MSEIIIYICSGFLLGVAIYNMVEAYRKLNNGHNNLEIDR